MGSGVEGEGCRVQGVAPQRDSPWLEGQGGTPTGLCLGRPGARVEVEVEVGVGVGWEAVEQAHWGEEGPAWQSCVPLRHCPAWETQGPEGGH